MTIIALILVLAAVIMFYYYAKGDSKEYSSAKKFFKALCFGFVQYYCKGTPTRVVMYALQGIMVMYTGAAIGYPLATAIINYDAEHQFYSILVQCQWNDFSSRLTYVFLGAIVLIVVVYLFTSNYETKAMKKISANTEETNENVKLIIEMLQKSNSTTIHAILPTFDLDIKTLKVESAYRHLNDIYTTLTQTPNPDKTVLAAVQCTMGNCARFIKSIKCTPHYEEAYKLVDGIINVDARLREQLVVGMIYTSCVKRQIEEQNKYIEELRQLNPKNYWIYVPQLANSDNLNASFAEIPDTIDKFMALVHAIIVGCKDQENQLGIDIWMYEYKGLTELTYENFPIWVYEMSIAASRFMQRMEIKPDVSQMWNKEAEDLYTITHTYLTLLEKTEMSNIMPDTVFLECLTGYFKDQDETRIERMAHEKDNVHQKEIYYLGYALMLMDKERYSDALMLLKGYGDDSVASVLNMRLNIAIRIGDVKEIAAAIKEVTEKKMDIPNHLLLNYFQAFNLAFDATQQYAKDMIIPDERSRFLFEQFILSKANQDVDIRKLEDEESNFYVPLYPFLAMIYKAKLGLDSAITLLRKCMDPNLVDLRFFTLIEYYSEDTKYSADLYHLLRIVRQKGILIDGYLRTELSMAERIYDSNAVCTISKLLMARYPNDGTYICYHIKALRALEKRDEIIQLQSQVQKMNITDVKIIKIIASVYMSIGEYAYAIEYLYDRIIHTKNQEIKDFFFQLSINPRFSNLVCNPKEVVALEDWVEVAYNGKVEEIEITPGSVYEDLVGKTVGEKVVLHINEDTQVSINEIHNKYFKLYKEIYADLAQHKSRTIQTVNIDDEKWKGDPLAAIQSILGDPKEKNASQSENMERYKNAELPLCVFIKYNEPVASMLDTLYDKSFKVYNLPSTFYRCLSRDGELIRDNEVVLDLSSLIVLYDISRRLGVPIEKKFIIPISLHYLLQGTLSEEEIGSPTFLSQAVCDEFLGEERDKTHSALWNIVKDMLAWVKEHCEIIIVEDKLNVEYPQGLPHLFIVNMDSIYLASKGPLLLTEDWGMQRFFSGDVRSMNVTSWYYVQHNDQAAQMAELMQKYGNIEITE